MRRILCIILFGTLAFLSLVFVLNGALEYRTFVRNPEPVKMSLGDFLNSQNKPDWVDLSDCQVDYAQGVAFRSPVNGQISEMAIAVYPDINRGPVRMVLVKAGANAANAYGSGAAPEKQSIKGLVRSTVSLNSIFMPITGLDARLRKTSQWQLDNGYSVIDAGVEPNSTKAACEVGGGLLVLIFAIWGLWALSTWTDDAPPSRKTYAASMQLTPSYQ